MDAEAEGDGCAYIIANTIVAPNADVVKRMLDLYLNISFPNEIGL